MNAELQKEFQELFGLIERDKFQFEVSNFKLEFMPFEIPTDIHPVTATAKIIEDKLQKLLDLLVKNYGVPLLLEKGLDSEGLPLEKLNLAINKFLNIRHFLGADIGYQILLYFPDISFKSAINLAQLYAFQNNPKNGIALLDQVKMPDKIEEEIQLLYSKCNLLYQNGDYENAEKIFEVLKSKAVKLPQFREIIEEFEISILLRKGDFDRGIKFYKEKIEHEEKSTYPQIHFLGHLHENLGLILLEKREFESALGEFLKAEKCLPNSLNVQFDIASAYEVLRRYDEAIDSLSGILQKSPNNPKALMSLANILSVHGKADAAASILKKIETQESYASGNPYFWKNLGLAQQNLGHYSEALNYFNKAIEMDPKIWEF